MMKTLEAGVTADSVISTLPRRLNDRESSWRYCSAETEGVSDMALVPSGGENYLSNDSSNNVPLSRVGRDRAVESATGRHEEGEHAA
jgi:hypothetical protein